MLALVNHPAQSHSQASGLERIPSADSSLTTSSDAAGSVHGYSTGTSAGTDLRTPVHHPDVDDHEPEEELTDHEDLYAEAAAARRRLAAVGTQSMQDLKKGKGRERSLTDAKPPPPSLILAPPVPSHPSVATRQPIQPTVVAKPAKASGSFSSFLRRLTGKGPKNKDKNIPTAPSPAVSQKPSPPQPTPAARPQPTRQGTAPVVPSAPTPKRAPAVRQNSMPARPVLSHIDTREPMRGPQPLSAPARPAPRAPIVPRETDPVKIPLPPSPNLSPTNPFDDDPADFTAPMQSSSRPSQRNKPPPMLSLEGFDFEEEETDEEADQIRPLQPLRITVGSSHRSLSPDSAPLKSSSSAETTIRTPSSTAAPNYYPVGSGSGSESSPEKSGMRLAGSTPPRKAPIGTGPMLDRKESKWRKSVMGISDTVVRKQTTRGPPPSSHDAYMIQQRRMGANRMSCQPTLHSNASIAAELTSIENKEEQDMAETFFLS